MTSTISSERRFLSFFPLRGVCAAMPAKKAAAKRPTPKPAAPKPPKPAAPPKATDEPARAPAKKRAAKAADVASKDPAAAPPAAKPKRTPAPPQPPVEKRRVVFPKDVYEARKDEIKAPLKERGLKWQYLGEGKGRYAKEGVNLFAQFLDDGVHYSLWGSDQATVDALLAAWRAMLGDSIFQEAVTQGAKAAVAEEQTRESEAVRLWKLQEPQRRPGEPDLFFRKRVAEWESKRPAA